MNAIDSKLYLEISELSFHSLIDIYPKSFTGFNKLIFDQGSTIYDIDGQTPIFSRYAIKINETQSRGYIDVAAHSLFPNPLLMVTENISWNPFDIIDTAMAKAKSSGLSCNDTKFIVYNFPRVGIQILNNNSEVIMWDAFSWEKIPLNDTKFNFRFSSTHFLNIGFSEKESQKSISSWIDVHKRYFKDDIFKFPLESQGLEKKFLCDYPLVPQEDEEWCVPACCQSILKYFDPALMKNQDELANDLGLDRNMPLDIKEVGRISPFFEKHNNGISTSIFQNKTTISEGDVLTFSDVWEKVTANISRGFPLINLRQNHAILIIGYDLMRVSAGLTRKSLRIQNPAPTGLGSYSWLDFTLDRIFFERLVIIEHKETKRTCAEPIFR